MKESKHIDRLFQEKFKDFEAQPSDAVWQNITASRNKKDRKIIPLWLWRLGGVAALLLLFITINNLWINPSASGSEVVNTENQNTEAGIENNGFKDNENGLTNSTTPPSSTSDDVSGINENQENNLNGITANDQSTTTENALKTTKNNTTITNKGIVVVNEKRDTPAHNYKQDDITNNKQTGTADAIAYEKETPSDEVIRLPEEEQLTKGVFPNEEQAISTSGQTTIAITSDEKVTEEEARSDFLENTKSLVEEAQRIAENQEEEDQITKEGNTGRWDVGAVAAPVVYGDFGGSGIDPQFSDNSKSRNANLSYGVQVSYAINDKFKIRSGVSNVDLSYSTNGVATIAGNPEAALRSQRALGNVDFNDNSATIVVLDGRTAASQQQALNPGDFPGGGNSIADGSLIQSLNYYEIPMEAVYVISDRRLGVEVIGGLSTLLLNNDEIELESQGTRTSIGTSNAVNSVSFTTNVGVGINYKLSDKLKVNLEPSLKYQLNAFSDSAGDFRPYIVGLYTGLSYRF